MTPPPPRAAVPCAVPLATPLAVPSHPSQRPLAVPLAAPSTVPSVAPLRRAAAPFTTPPCRAPCLCDVPLSCRYTLETKVLYKDTVSVPPSALPYKHSGPPLWHPASTVTRVPWCCCALPAP